MSRVNLPLGKKPLPVIRRVNDPIDRIEDYAKLLEWLLVIHVSAGEPDEQLEFLGAHVQRHAHKFSNIQFVNAAIGVYNDIKHAKPAKGRPPPTEAQIEGAASNLETAVLEILPYVPDPVRRAVSRDPRFWGIPNGVILAGVFLFGLAILVFLVAKLDDFGKSARRASWNNEDPEVRLQYAKQAQNQAITLATNAEAALDSAERERRAWIDLTSKLLTNEAGRRLAQSEQSLRETANLLAQARLGSDELGALRQKVVSISNPIRDALTDKRSNLYPQATEVRELELILDRATECARGYKHDSETLNGMLARAPGGPTASVTLEQAITNLREADRIAKAEADQKAEEAAAEARAVRKALLSARAAAYEEELTNKRAEFQRLRALAADEQNKAKFEPFLAAGTRVPYCDRKSVRWQNEHGRAAGPATPMKYEWLIQARVLESVEDMIAVGTHAGNDRPKWSPPKSEQDRREFVERFELLKQIAPVWHDMGLLGPPPAEPHFPDPDILASALRPLQGEWRYRQHDYDLLIVGDTGVMTRVSTPKQRLGATVLRFTKATGSKLQGKHEFDDGTWCDVETQLRGQDVLQLHAVNGWNWSMERLKESR